LIITLETSIRLGFDISCFFISSVFVIVIIYQPLCLFFLTIQTVSIENTSI